jgi:hypothetical protein
LTPSWLSKTRQTSTGPNVTDLVLLADGRSQQFLQQLLARPGLPRQLAGFQRRSWQ